MASPPLISMKEISAFPTRARTFTQRNTMAANKDHSRNDSTAVVIRMVVDPERNQVAKAMQADAAAADP